jgi:hypothetical protein
MGGQMGQSTMIAPKIQTFTTSKDPSYAARARVARAILAMSELSEFDQEAITAAALGELRSVLQEPGRFSPEWIRLGHG